MGRLPRGDGSPFVVSICQLPAGRRDDASEAGCLLIGHVVSDGVDCPGVKKHTLPYPRAVHEVDPSRCQFLAPLSWVLGRRSAEQPEAMTLAVLGEHRNPPNQVGCSPTASNSCGPGRGRQNEKREESAKYSTEYRLFAGTAVIIASVLNPNDFKGWSERL